MLKTKGVNLLAIDLVVSENSTIDEFDNSKVNGAKIETKTAKSKSQDKSKS